MQSSLPLPSRGKVYPVPLADIQVRTLKGGDEKLLAELTLDNIERKYLALLQNRIHGGDPVVKGIDAGKLTLGDRLYILVWERINSHSPQFTVEYLCEHCYQKNITAIDLSSLEVKELPDSFIEPYPLTLSNGDTISLRLFRLEDEIKVVDWEKKAGLAESYLYKLALSIVGGGEIKEKIAYLENLETVDLNKIKAFHEETVHGPIMDKIAYTCPKCGEAGHLALPFRPDFLIPRGSEVI